jgi:hypothetical protein
MGRRRIRTLVIAAAGAALLASAGSAHAVRLVDVSRQAGVRDISHTWSATAGDINGDAFPDLLVVNHYEKPAYLYRGSESGRFSRIGTGPGTFQKRDRHDCAFGDANVDGRTDIYCTIGGGRGTARKPNELWIQRPSGTFENRANEFGVVDINGRGRDTTFIDANRDGLPDLYVGNKFPRADRRKSINKLYINVDGTRYRLAGEYGVNREVGGKNVQRVDYNGDGFDDLLVCGERHLFLYRNIGGQRFENVSRPAHVDYPCEQATMARFDGDPRPDIAIVTRTRLKILHQRANGTFARAGKRRVRGGTAIAAGRVNGDSLADLYVVQGGDPEPPDLVLLARPGGRSFNSIGAPQTRRGKGDNVEAFDYDLNGRTDFVVLNGEGKHRGPVRLLATRP